MKTKVTIIISLFVSQMFAQDIKAAYISAKRVSGFTYSITVVLFTDASLNIIRPTVPINFGDASSGTFTLNSISNINGTNIKTYSGIHLYSGVGDFLPFYIDTFRVASIKNIQNSHLQQIYVETKIAINNFQQNASSPSVIFPLNFSVSGNQVIYNPNAADTDNDSLSYQITNCSGTSNYYLPVNATINNSTGTFSFSKDSIGLYAFSFIIKEWRKSSSNIYYIIASSQMDFVIDITTTIGVNEFTSQNSNILIYPNPTKDILNIDYDIVKDINSKLQILNSLGQIVYSLNNPTQKQQIDLSFLSSGIYYLKVQNNSEKKVFKIIKE